MILKKIAGIAFIISFLMAIVVFTGQGTQFISFRAAKSTFLILGATGLLLNLLSFPKGKGSLMYNFIYWIGSVFIFIGLTFKILYYPYSTPIIIAGMAVFTLSFFVSADKAERQKSSEIIDDLN